MDCASTVDCNNDPLSLNEDFIEMDAGENEAEMSDGEIQSELKVSDRWSDCLKLSGETAVTKKTLSSAPLATPKICSVVVIPEKSRSSSLSRLKVTASGSPVKTKTDAKPPKRSRNRKSSAKNSASRSEGSLAALLSKVTVSGGSKDIKPTNERINGTGTPTTAKRPRSTGTTPEGEKKQPDKLVKSNHGSVAVGIGSGNLLERRTLNLKVCLTNRPLNGNEMQTIRKFLQYQIEKSLELNAKFIPTFADPCRTKKDGVYVFCSDQECAQWLMAIVGVGIPDVVGRLKVLPQETPLKFEPEFMSVRVMAFIPTKRPKSQILKDLAQLNRELNTEKWCIKNIRPKGSGSMCYMRIDKRSFDTISARVDNRINWILGPINVWKEEHRSQTKNPGPSSANVGVTSTGNIEPMDNHFKPPSTGSVDGTPASLRLSKNGQSGPSGLNNNAVLNDDCHHHQHTPLRSTSENCKE